MAEMAQYILAQVRGTTSSNRSNRAQKRERRADWCSVCADCADFCTVCELLIALAGDLQADGLRGLDGPERGRDEGEERACPSTHQGILYVAMCMSAWMSAWACVEL